MPRAHGCAGAAWSANQNALYKTALTSSSTAARFLRHLMLLCGVLLFFKNRNPYSSNALHG